MDQNKDYADHYNIATCCNKHDKSQSRKFDNQQEFVGTSMLSATLPNF